MIRPRYLVSALVVASLATTATGQAGAAKKTTKKTTKKPVATVPATTAAPATAAPTTAAPATAAPTTVAAPAAGAESRPLPADGDKNGVLKLGIDMVTSGGMVWDPIKMTVPSQTPNIFQVYEPLLHWDVEKAAYRPGLATAAKVINDNTISVTLRSGAKFQNGEPVDADAVKAALERNVKANNRVGMRTGELLSYDSLEVKSPTQFNIKLKTPTAGSFYNLLAFQETIPVPPKAIAAGADLGTKGLGSGPFQIDEFVNGDHATLTKWDGYWNAANIRIAKVEWRNAVGADAFSLALRSGNIDGMRVPLETYRQLAKTDLQSKAFLNPDFAVVYSPRCVGALADARVRQALAMSLDAAVIARAAYGEDATRMTDFFASGPYHGTQDYFKRDLDKAKALVAAAGANPLRFRIGVVTGDAISELVGSLALQQWTQAGFQPTIVTSPDILDFAIRGQADMILAPTARVWTDKLGQYLPGGISTCVPANFGDTEFNGLVAKMRTLDPSDAAAKDLWASIQKKIFEPAYNIPIAHGPSLLMWNKRLGDVAWKSDNNASNWYPDVYRVYIKK